MSWFKVDDGFHNHPKAMAAGNAACGLWSRCGSYCSQQPSTEGVVPDAIAKAYGTKAEIARLVAVGMWEPVEGGYRMHDYHEYNPTAEQAKAKKASRSESGREGGIKSGESRRAKAAAEREAEANSEANASRKTKQTLQAKTNPDPTRPDPTHSGLHDLTTTDDYRLSPEQMSSVEIALRIAARATYEWKPDKCHTNVETFVEGIYANMRAEKALIARRLIVETNDPITAAQKLLPTAVGKTRCRIAARNLGFNPDQEQAS